MRKNPFRLVLILLSSICLLFTQQTKAQQMPDLKKAKHFAVFSAKTLTDNNVLQTNGYVAAKYLIGNAAAADSVLSETDAEFLQASDDFNFLKDSFSNISTQIPFILTAGDYVAAVYSSNTPTTTLNGGGINSLEQIPTLL